MQFRKKCACNLGPLLYLVLMSFFIVLPFFIGILIPYIKFSKRKGDGDSHGHAVGSDKDLVTGLTENCQPTRVVGLLEKIYPDDLKFRFVCNGVIVDKNHAYFLQECFSKSKYKKPTKRMHVIVSGTLTWFRDANYHRIEKSTTIENTKQPILSLLVWPAFPLDCMELSDKAPIEKYDPSKKYKLTGWDRNTSFAADPIKDTEYKYECTKPYSGVIFTEDCKVVGFNPLDCKKGETDTLIPIPPTSDSDQQEDIATTESSTEFQTFTPTIDEGTLVPDLDKQEDIVTTESFTEFQTFTRTIDEDTLVPIPPISDSDKQEVIATTEPSSDVKNLIKKDPNLS